MSSPGSCCLSLALSQKNPPKNKAQVALKKKKKLRWGAWLAQSVELVTLQIAGLYVVWRGLKNKIFKKIKLLKCLKICEDRKIFGVSNSQELFVLQINQLKLT